MPRKIKTTGKPRKPAKGVSGVARKKISDRALKTMIDRTIEEDAPVGLKTLVDLQGIMQGIDRRLLALEEGRASLGGLLAEVHGEAREGMAGLGRRLAGVEAGKAREYEEEITALRARLHKLETRQQGIDDRELAHYTRQIGHMESAINGMRDNISAYDNRIAAVETLVRTSETADMNGAYLRLARRVAALERQNRYTGAYSDAVEKGAGNGKEKDQA